MKKYLSIPLIALLASCSYEFPATPSDAYTPNKGNADFGKYAAVGNSITAGFMDGALYQEGQDGAFPNLLWSRMKEVDVSSANFVSPTVGTQIGYAAERAGIGVLGRLRFDDPSLSPVYDPAFPATGNCAGDSYTPKPMVSDVTAATYFAPTGVDVSTMGNFGIPGIQLGQFLTPATGTPNGNPAFNPYYLRFASAPGQSSPVTDVLAASPSFFTFWLGANDVLGYASSGGLIPLTDPAAFASMYQTAVSTLVSSGAKGMVANIPDLLEMPYFKVVTDQVAPVTFPLDAATAATLNGAYALQGFSNVNFVAGNNRLLIETGTGDIRQFRPGKDRVTFAMAIDGATSKLGTNPVVVCGQQVGQGDGMGVIASTGAAYPIPNRYVLDEDEIAAAKTALAQYNASISATANDATIAGSVGMVDMYTAFNNALQSGVRDSKNIALTLLTVSISPGGGVSTDGLHPNPRGHAWIANLFIEEINTKFGTNMKSYELRDFRGNEFPVP